MAVIVLGAVDVADADVLAGRDLIGGVVLEHHPELTAQLDRVVLPHVAAVDEDLPFIGVVEATQQLHHRRLAGAVASDQGDGLSRLDGERDVVQRQRFGRDSGS